MYTYKAIRELDFVSGDISRFDLFVSAESSTGEAYKVSLPLIVDYVTFINHRDGGKRGSKGGIVRVLGDDFVTVALESDYKMLVVGTRLFLGAYFLGLISAREDFNKFRVTGAPALGYSYPNFEYWLPIISTVDEGTGGIPVLKDYIYASSSSGAPVWNMTGGIQIYGKLISTYSISADKIELGGDTPTITMLATVEENIDQPPISVVGSGESGGILQVGSISPATKTGISISTKDTFVKFSKLNVDVVTGGGTTEDQKLTFGPFDGSIIDSLYFDPTLTNVKFKNLIVGQLSFASMFRLEATSVWLKAVFDDAYIPGITSGKEARGTTDVAVIKKTTHSETGTGWVTDFPRNVSTIIYSDEIVNIGLGGIAQAKVPFWDDGKRETLVLQSTGPTSPELTIGPVPVNSDTKSWGKPIGFRLPNDGEVYLLWLSIKSADPQWNWRILNGSLLIYFRFLSDDGTASLFGGHSSYTQVGNITKDSFHFNGQFVFRTTPATRWVMPVMLNDLKMGLPVPPFVEGLRVELCTVGILKLA